MLRRFMLLTSFPCYSTASLINSSLKYRTCHRCQITLNQQVGMVYEINWINLRKEGNFMYSNSCMLKSTHTQPHFSVYLPACLYIELVGQGRGAVAAVRVEAKERSISLAFSMDAVNHHQVGKYYHPPSSDRFWTRLCFVPTQSGNGIKPDISLNKTKMVGKNYVRSWYTLHSTREHTTTSDDNWTETKSYKVSYY